MRKIRINIQVGADRFSPSDFAWNFRQFAKFISRICETIRIRIGSMGSDNVTSCYRISLRYRVQIPQKPAFEFLADDPDEYVPCGLDRGEIAKALLMQTAISPVIISHNDKTVPGDVPSAEFSWHRCFKIRLSIMRHCDPLLVLHPIRKYFWQGTAKQLDH